MSDLPSGWTEAKFGDITVYFDGKRVPVKASERAMRRGSYRYFGAQGVIDHIDDYIFDSTYLLIAEDGANLVSRAQPIAQIASGKFWVNNHAHVVQAANGTSLKFLMHFLNGNPLNGSIRGTAQPKLTKADLNKLCVPVPPMAEQERIVAAIEEQFSRLDAGTVALDQAHRNLELMRASALNDLLRTENGNTFPDVPLGYLLVNGRYGTSTKCSYGGEGLPVLRIPNIKSGQVDLTDLKYAVDASVNLESSLVEEGDILVVRTNGSRSLIGRSAAVAELKSETSFASYLIRLKVDRSKVNPDFLVAALGSLLMRRRIESLAATSAGQYNISLQKLRSLRIPLPSLEEQVRSLSSLVRLFSNVDRVEREISRANGRAARLRSSILAAAFSGELA